MLQHRDLKKVKKTCLHLFVFYIGTDLPLDQWVSLFDGPAPELLTEKERDEWVRTMDKVALASDAFFPFRDNIDRAVQVRYFLHIYIFTLRAVTLFFKDNSYTVINVLTQYGLYKSDFKLAIH